MQPSRERRLEAAAQGNAFMIAVRSAWPCAAVDRFAAEWTDDVAYTVALGVAAAGHGAPLGTVLRSPCWPSWATLVSAVVRLGPIGQTDGQKIIAAMLPHVRGAAAFAAASSLDDVGGAAYRSDIASLRHETQYSRLFRS